MFKKIDDIPPLLVKTLLFLENRDLDRPATSLAKPGDRMGQDLQSRGLLLGGQVPAAGTAARRQHARRAVGKISPLAQRPHRQPLEKLRQMVGASLKAYQAKAPIPGLARTHHRRLFEYRAAGGGARYGEIHGLGEGLYAWFGMRLSDVVRDFKAPRQ